jgi:hypothetical protein
MIRQDEQPGAERSSGNGRQALDLAARFQESTQALAGVDLDAYPPNVWRDTVNILLSRGQLAAARRIVSVLADRGTDQQPARTLLSILDNVPTESPLSSFHDDPQAEVQVARCAGARTVLLVFSDYQHHIGLPFALVHRWFGLAPAHIVYLRDFSKAWFMSGIGSLALTRDATIERLRALSKSLGAERIVCFSNSSGGFAAVAYGLALGAERIACMAGAFDLRAIKSPRAKRMLAAAEGYDLRRAFPAAARPAEVRIVLGESNWDDRLHADYLADLRGVTVLPIEGFAGHTIAVEMMDRGRFGEMVDWLMTPPAAPR